MKSWWCADAATERVEIHCHGGSAAVDHVLDTLAAPGVRRSRPPRLLAADPID